MRQPHQPQLLTVNEAANLLRVTDATILSWISAGTIPYLELPDSGGYRIPQASLLASLDENFDLAADGRTLDEHFAGASEDDIETALDLQAAIAQRQRLLETARGSFAERGGSVHELIAERRSEAKEERSQ